jgi:hypothetical protein
LGDLADWTGLTDERSAALAPLKQRQRLGSRSGPGSCGNSRPVGAHHDRLLMGVHREWGQGGVEHGDGIGGGAGVRFIVGHPLTEALAAAIIGRRLRWVPAITADGTAEREVGDVAEVTPYVDLSGWPPGSRLLVRREIPHPGAQLTFTDVHGYRSQLCLTHLTDPDITFLEALYRGRGRCEQVIRDLKATGLAHLPSADFATNQAWLTAVCLVVALLAWFHGLDLTGRWRQATPARWRYALLHVAGRLVRSGRRVVVRLAAGWPWAPGLTAAVTRCQHRR